MAASVKLIFFGEKEKGASRRLIKIERRIIFLNMVFCLTGLSPNAVASEIFWLFRQFGLKIFEGMW